MKRVRNNLFNKLFRPKALKEYKAWKEKAIAIIGWNKQLNEDLTRAKTLQDLINVHKHAWQIGYNSPNIAPCPWGMFRCDSIPVLTLDTLYLGDIWGLWTNNGRFWEEHKHETMANNGFGIKEDELVYDIIVQQYRQHLRSNLNAISKNMAEDLLK
ncbi:MAG: hypothetical protein J6S67_18835 [Methanobrevibacter sp.]|nr:hypothetical protein [Methanobrevibacter sp.]